MRSTAERSARPRRPSGSAETAPTAASPRAASRWTRRAASTSPAAPTASAPAAPTSGSTAPDGTLLAALRAPGTDVFLNDVAIGPDGAAYFTNSNDAQVFRVADDGNGWKASLWADATDTIERKDGFNLGGIVLTADRSAFVVAQGNTGRLWRFSTRTRHSRPGRDRRRRPRERRRAGPPGQPAHRRPQLQQADRDAAAHPRRPPGSCSSTRRPARPTASSPPPRHCAAGSCTSTASSTRPSRPARTRSSRTRPDEARRPRRPPPRARPGRVRGWRPHHVPGALPGPRPEQQSQHAHRVGERVARLGEDDRPWRRSQR